MVENKYKSIIEKKYNDYNEDERFERRSQRFEYLTTMRYIQNYAKKGCKILEIGAATGRYSIALAKLGFDVTAVELVDKNFQILCQKSEGIKNIKCIQGDVLDLSMLEDNEFDIVLNLGPMYHLFNKKDKDRAISESIRVCKTNGIIMFAYLPHASIVWGYGVRKGNLSSIAYALEKDGSIRDIPEEVFSSFYIEDFAKQFEKTNTVFLKNIATDGVAPMMRDYIDDKMSDEDYKLLLDWHFATCERLDQQGLSSHLLYICKKEEKGQKLSKIH